MEHPESRPLLVDDQRLEYRVLQNNETGWLSVNYEPYFQSTRKQIRRFLTSKVGHYAVLLLVSLDVSCIFADFLISLFVSFEGLLGALVD